MALDAGQSQMRVLEWEAGRGIVVEGRSVPVRFIVAHLAIRRELRGRMRRIGRGVVILLVAGHTSGGGPRKPLCMTLIAAHRTMSAVQRKTGFRIVVERTGLPSFLPVAILAIGAETCRRMIRIGRGVEIFLVAIIASGRSTRVALRMALVACQTQMPALKRKTSGFVVVESGRFPIRFIMAHLAICRKLCGRMRRIGRGVVILLVGRPHKPSMYPQNPAYDIDCTKPHGVRH